MKMADRVSSYGIYVIRALIAFYLHSELFIPLPSMGSNTLS